MAAGAPQAGTGRPRVWLRYLRPRLLEGEPFDRILAHAEFAGIVADIDTYRRVAEGRPREILEGLSTTAAPASAPAESDDLLRGRLVADARSAADRLRPLFERSRGAAGLVVVPTSPHAAEGAEGLKRAAGELRRAINRPNVAVELPSDSDGQLEALRDLLAEGVSVHVLAAPDPDRLRAIAAAFRAGLTRVSGGATPTAAVRISLTARKSSELGARPSEVPDPASNGELETARACAGIWDEAFAGFRAPGDGHPPPAGVVRLIWEDLEPLDPGEPEGQHWDSLLLQEGTDLAAHEPLFASHFLSRTVPGRLRPRTPSRSNSGADASVRGTRDANWNEVRSELRRERVAAYDRSRAVVAARTGSADAEFESPRQTFALPPDARRAVAERLGFWRAQRFGSRVWEKDPTLWFDPPRPELETRLGWLRLPFSSPAYLRSLTALGQEVAREGARHALVLGMGGSSLAPAAFAAVFGPAPGFPEVLVVDTTHPDAIRAVSDRIDPERSVFVVSSKSGTTAETLALFRHFWARVSPRDARAGRRFIAITDPGTPLVDLARRRGFRRWVPGPPEVGGRYSALSAFGLVPAALLGVDLAALIDRAAGQAAAGSFDTPEPEDPGLTLGAALGELGIAGRDKVTFAAPRELAALPVWIEQLIAESTGKEGHGLIPVVGEPRRASRFYADDRVFVSFAMENDNPEDIALAELERRGAPLIRIRLRDPYDVGAEFFRWELAIAAAGAVLGIHPFDQPDVELAKELARQALQRGGEAATVPRGVRVGALGGSEVEDEATVGSLRAWLSEIRPPAYVAIQAYLAPAAAADRALGVLREWVGTTSGAATTLGYGPRFLHSTGQLHKGGPATVRCLQIRDRPETTLAIPESEDTFNALVSAQARGDVEALAQRGRSVFVLELGARPAEAFRRLETSAGFASAAAGEAR